jgi:hypothetical protein
MSTPVVMFSILLGPGTYWGRSTGDWLGLLDGSAGVNVNRSLGVFWQAYRMRPASSCGSD